MVSGACLVFTSNYMPQAVLNMSVGMVQNYYDEGAITC